MTSFRFPPGDSRTVVIGMTGSGKTTMGAWLLSNARLDKRPWIIFDYKGEELFDAVGYPPIQKIKVGQMPGKRGLYLASPRPDEDDAVEAWLWKLWAHENIGLFFDEVSLVPHQSAFKAILRQGRSKRMPVISCTQRPVDVEREVFTEANFISLFQLEDARDYKVVKEFTNNPNGLEVLPKRWSYWYDKVERVRLTLKPVPHPDIIAKQLRQMAPYSWFLGG